MLLAWSMIVKHLSRLCLDIREKQKHAQDEEIPLKVRILISSFRTFHLAKNYYQFSPKHNEKPDKDHTKTSSPSTLACRRKIDQTLKIRNRWKILSKTFLAK